MDRKSRRRSSRLVNLKRFIYLVSPEKIYKNFYTDLKKVLAFGNVKFFQLRVKKLPKKQIITIGKKVKLITKQYKIKLIINDKPEITQAIKADGCHVGQLDASLSDARKILKRKIIGVTCHNSKHLALEASKNNAAYVAFGSFFQSKLKPEAQKANMKVLRWAKKKLKYQLL